MLISSKSLRIILSSTYFIALIVLLSGCGPRIDGGSEQTFKQSFQKIKSGLSSKDTAKLTAAIKVLAFAIMGQQMVNYPDYEGKSVDAILMKQLDGKTYSSIVSIAEDSLKTNKQRDVALVQKQINDLQTDMRKKKAVYDSLKSKLSIIQGRLIKIEMKDGNPVVYCEFKNVSSHQLEHFSFEVVARSISKKNLVFSASHSYGGVKTLSHNDTIMMIVPIDEFYRNKTPEVPWATIKYPVTNTQAYNFNIEAYADEIRIDDKDYDLDTVKWSFNDQDDYNKKYKELTAQLKEEKNRSENLNDIE